MFKQIALFLLLTTSIFSQHITGTGSIANPYILYNTADFDSIRHLGMNKCYKLAADLDFTSWGTFTQFGGITSGYFKLDGDGYTISNITIQGAAGTLTDATGSALFPQVSSGADSVFFDNIKFENCDLTVNSTPVNGGGYAILIGSINAPTRLNKLKFNNCDLSVNASSTAEGTDGQGYRAIVTGIVNDPIVFSNIVVDSCIIDRKGFLEGSGNDGFIIGKLTEDATLKYITIRYDSIASTAAGNTASCSQGGIIGSIASVAVDLTISDSYGIYNKFYNESYATNAVAGGIFGKITSFNSLQITRCYVGEVKTQPRGNGGLFGGELTVPVGKTATISDSYYGEMYSYVSPNLVAGYDFTDSWTTSSATVNSSTNFTTSGTGGIYKDITSGNRECDLLIASNNYLISWAGTSNVSRGMRNSNGTSSNTIMDDFGSTTYTAAANGFIYFRNPSAGSTTVTSFSVQLASGSYYYPDTTGITAKTIDGTLMGNVSHKSTVDLQDSSKYNNYDFNNIWGYDPAVQDGYPFLLSSMDLYLSSPQTGDHYTSPEELSIDWIGVDTLTIYYSINDGDDYTLLTYGASSPYIWDYTDLSLNTTEVKVKIKSDTKEVESGAFTIESRYINILYPIDSVGIASLGDSVLIRVEVVGIDTLSLLYSVGDTLSWQKIVEDQFINVTGKDTVEYNWVLPNINGTIYLKATEVADTNHYNFERSLLEVGNNRLSVPTICWDIQLNTPIESHWFVDQSCGWASPPWMLVNATIKDKANGYDFTTEYCGPPYTSCAVDYSDGVWLADGADTTYTTLNNFYNHGSTLTYRDRLYYISNDSLLCNDLRNNIDNIFISNLSDYNGWFTSPSVLWVYNVQRSKIQNDTLDVDTTFESLNDSDFDPMILMSSLSPSGGYLTYGFEALPKPGRIDPAYDMVTMFESLSLRRDYFRGIHPKARKHR